MELKQNPKIPEGINSSEEHPLKEFSILLGGITFFVVVLAVTLSLAAQQLAPFIPFEWELRLIGNGEFLQDTFSGNNAAHAADTQEKQDAYRQVEQALSELTAQLAVHMEKPDGMSFRLSLIEQDAPNAFATLGGHIFVTTGLLRELNSENALSMVLAHEMAHIKYRHPIQSLGRGAVFQLVVLLATGGQGNGAVQSVLGNAGLLTLLSFNREMEREADTESVKVLLAHYGHLNGADEFFVRMRDQHGSGKYTEMFHTHPGLDSRIKVLQADDKKDAVLVEMDRRLRL